MAIKNASLQIRIINGLALGLGMTLVPVPVLLLPLLRLRGT
jgi:hypothetical protein